MKKITILSSLVGVLLFSGCSVGDLFIDQVAVHNSLVDTMDAVLRAEENFYDEYWALEDNADTTAFEAAFSEFETAVGELDTFFMETKFASGQMVFKEDYEANYKPFIDDYVEYAKEFTDAVATSGYTYESMEPYFEELDEFTVDFVDVHNTLIGTINTQSDYATSGQSY